MRRILALLLTVGLSSVMVLPMQSAHADDFVPAEIEKSIVWVDVIHESQVWVPGSYFDDGVGSYLKKTGVAYSGCTGWFASNTGDIVTAGHCVQFDEDIRERLILDILEKSDLMSYREDALRDWQIRKKDVTRSVTVGQPQGVVGGPLEDDSITAQVVAFQRFDNGDNALLRVSDLVSVGLPLTVAPPGIGDTVTSIGFGGSVSAVSDVRRQRPSFKEGSVSSRQYTDNGVPNTEIDAVVTAGMSGGPTVDVTGAVIGVNSFGITGETQSVNFVTDGETLSRFLVTNGVTAVAPPVPAESPSASAEPSGSASAEPSEESVETESAGPAQDESDGGGSNLLLYVLIGLGVLVALAIALMLVLLLKNRNKGTSAPSHSAAHEPAAPTQPIQQQYPQDPVADVPPRQ